MERILSNSMGLTRGHCSHPLYRLYFTYSESSGQARITVPHRMVEKMNKVKQKASAKKHQAKRAYKGPVLISCKRREFNHHQGQTYSNFTPQCLASGGWKHPRSKGDYFTIHGMKTNPALGEDNSTFTDLGVYQSIVDVLQSKGINSPTAIQEETIPVLLQGQNVICAAETGSGKTLAYLVPILQKLIDHKRQFGHNAEPNQPQAVILTPLRELALQIQEVTSAIGGDLGFHSKAIVGGQGTKKLIRNPPMEAVDILITTPGVFSKMLTNRIYSASRLADFVLDEADTLLDDSFNELTVRLIHKMKIQSERLETDSEMGAGTRVALVSATMPTSVEQILGDMVPMNSIRTVTTPYLHKVMPHVPQKFVRVNNLNKKDVFMEAARTNIKKKIPTIVFCNKAESAAFIYNIFKTEGIEHASLHSLLPRHLRNHQFEMFQSGEVDFLVCTDIASRGLDTVRAQHVINFDFPNFMSDYIHRVGRVGRVGGQGSCFVLSLVQKKWEVDLLWKIEMAVRRVTELHNVNANIKRKLVGVYESKLENEQNNNSDNDNDDGQYSPAY